MNKHLFTLIQFLLFIQQIVISSQAIIQDDPSSTEVDLNNTHTPNCAPIGEAVDLILDQLKDVPHYTIRMPIDHSTSTDVDPCKTATLNILKGLIKLKELMANVNPNSRSSSFMYTVLSLNLLLSIRETQVDIDTLYNLANPDDKPRISELETQLKIFQEQTQETVTVLECRKKEKPINKCISLIDEYAQKCGVLDSSKHVNGEIVKEWSNNIVSGGFGRNIDLQSERNLSYLDQLIRNVYGEDPFEATLKIINKLHNLEEKSVAFTSLYNAMKEKSIDTPNIFRLAYHVKEIMSGRFGDYLSQPKEVISRFEALKNNLPPSVKAILWDSVSIKNRLHNEYLFAGREYPFDDDRRRIFTCRQKGRILANSEWKLDTINEGRSFRIKSVEHEEYMYPSDHALFDGERRRVFTWRHENEIDQTGEWLLEPIEGATAFKLKSVYQNEYFYAAADDLSYDSDRRRVFTWTYKGISASVEELWEITAF